MERDLKPQLSLSELDYKVGIYLYTLKLRLNNIRIHQLSHLKTFLDPVHQLNMFGAFHVQLKKLISVQI